MLLLGFCEFSWASGDVMRARAAPPWLTGRLSARGGLARCAASLASCKAAALAAKLGFAVVAASLMMAACAALASHRRSDAT